MGASTRPRRSLVRAKPGIHSHGQIARRTSAFGESFRLAACALRQVSARAFPYGLPLPFCLFLLRSVLLHHRLLLCPHWLALSPAASRGPTPPQGNPGWPPCCACLFREGHRPNRAAEAAKTIP